MTFTEALTACPGRVLAYQQLEWGVLLCSDEGPYVYKDGELFPAGGPYEPETKSPSRGHSE